MNKKLFFSILLSGSLCAQTYSSTSAVAIPDNNATGITSTIPVSLVKTINDASKVTINLDLTHSWIGDVTIALVVPGSSGVGNNAVIKRIGSTTPTGVGSSANFLAGNIISFNSAAAATISTTGLLTTSNIPTGVYLPTVSSTLIPTDYAVADLSAMFSNLVVAGDWTIKLFDNASGDTGSVNNWQVVFDPGTFLGVDTSIINNPALSVMGNPFKETLNLKVNTAAKDVKFDIYSLDGKKVYSHNQATMVANGELKISTDSWAKGMYILSPSLNGEKLMSIKLIKK